MPILATSAKGVINVMMEANPGEQLLLAETAITATITGITAPSGSTGMRFLIRVRNWTTSGSLTVTGTGTPGNTETFTVAAPPSQPQQNSQLSAYQVVTVNSYTAITNITTTGLTNGLITVWGIQSGKYQLPGTMTSNRVVKVYSPNEHNSLIEQDKKVMHLTAAPVFDIKQDAYGDLSLWWPYMAMGAPTTTATIPASPTSLFAATSLSASQTLTTPPSAPGMKLIIAITAFSVAGTLTISGTVNGVANTTETVSVVGNGTYYSSNVYQAATVTITNSGTTATMAVTGVFGWQYTFLTSANLYSAAVEWYDGAGSWTHPFCIAEEADFDAKVQAEIALNLKGKCQDKLLIGDPTTTPLTGINRVASLGVNLSDEPMVGWQTLVYLDDITGTPMTTSQVNVQELKISGKIPQEEHYTFTNSQTFNRAYAVKRSYMIDATLDFVDATMHEYFRQNLKKYLGIQFLGRYIGTSTTPYYKSWAWTLPFRSDGNFDVTSDPKKGQVTAKAKWIAEYDAGIGASAKLVVTSQVPPVYTV